jgi:hypothetical protein
VLALLANTNSLAAAAQAAGPGDQFYPLKTSLESVRLALALSPAQEAELSIQQAQARLLELTGLVLEGDLVSLAETAGAYELKVSRALTALEKVAGQDPAEAARLAQVLQSNVFDQASLLGLLFHSLPENHQAYHQGHHQGIGAGGRPRCRPGWRQPAQPVMGRKGFCWESQLAAKMVEISVIIVVSQSRSGMSDSKIRKPGRDRGTGLRG